MALIRALLFSLYFWSVSIAMTVSYIPALVFAPRRVLTRGQRRWAKLVMAGLRMIAGIGIDVRGHAHIPRGGALIAAKHMSLWDTIIFHVLLDDPAFVMKRLLLYVPLYGQVAWRTRMIVVDRKGHAKSLKRMVREAREALGAGRQIVIFPEGTRKTPHAAPDYKPGIAALYKELAVPCTPVALNSGLYWPRRGFVRPPGTIVIEFLPAIPQGLDRRAFMDTLQTKIEQATAVLVDGASATVDKLHQTRTKENLKGTKID